MSNNQNRSRARSFRMEYKSGNTLAYLNFLSNINSREYTMDSNNLQIDFLSPPGSQLLLGIKTPRTVAIVLLSSQRAELKQQMDIDSNFLNKNQITCFKFDPRTVMKDNSKLQAIQVVVGFNTGLIQTYNLFGHSPLQSYNCLDPHQDVWLKRKVLKIAVCETRAVALFEGGILMQIDLLLKNQPNEVMEQISSFLSGFSFKSLNNSSILNEHFTTSVLAQGVFNIMSLRLKNQSLNPQSLYKLEWTMTTKVEILPFNPMDHLNAAKNGELKGQVDYKKPFLIVAFSSLDGYFRIVELLELQPQFSFRSDYGGFNSFAFNSGYQMVCLSGQDDCCYIINFESRVTWMKMTGHCSFISSAVFSQVEEKVRVIIGSYDGYLSFSELDKSLFQKYRQEDQSQKVQEDLLDMNGSNCRNRVVQVQNKLLMNEDGICYLREFQNFLATVNFDGCISIFHMEDYENQDEQSPQKQQEEEQPPKQQQQQQNRRSVKE